MPTHTYTYLYTYTYTYLYTYPVHLHIHLYVHLPVHLHVHLHRHLYVHLRVHLYVHLPVHLPVLSMCIGDLSRRGPRWMLCYLFGVFGEDELLLTCQRNVTKDRQMEWRSMSGIIEGKKVSENDRETR